MAQYRMKSLEELKKEFPSFRYEKDRVYFDGLAGSFDPGEYRPDSRFNINVEKYEKSSLNDKVFDTGTYKFYKWDLILADTKQITKDKAIMDKFKSFLEKNSDTFFTIGLIILLDHFVFDGAFREKIKSAVDSMLNKVNKQIGE